MITEDRLRHILGVARRCYDLAMERGWDNDSCNQMFVLGFLHDIGYEFSDNAGHAEEGGIMLESIAFPFNNAVRKHGMPLPISEQSEELQILNQADIETSSNGVHITAEQRLQDVAMRYGIESVQYANMFELCKQLKLIDS